MTAHLYAFIEPALVGGSVFVALAVALRRFVPKRRSAGAAGCSECTGCGACPGTAATQTQPIVVHKRIPVTPAKAGVQ